jgi:hypothetical protein
MAAPNADIRGNAIHFVGNFSTADRLRTVSHKPDENSGVD